MSFDPASVDGLSVADLIDRWAREKPEAVFAIDPASGDALTFQRLQSACRSVASKLTESGLSPGASVAYALPNGLSSIRIILGVLYGGYLATAINLVAGQKTISYVLDHSDAAIVFVDDTSHGLLRAAGGRAEMVLVSEDWFSAAVQGLPMVKGEVDGLLMYTSGTTGVPKGVVHTHESLLAGGANTALAHYLGAEDRGLCVLPLYHINAFCVSLMGVLVSGGSLVVPNKFSVSAFWDHMRAHRCTWFSVVPTQISYLIHEAETHGHSADGLAQVRFGRSASAPLATEVQQVFEKRFGIPIIETMGLTETAAQILSNPMDGPRKIGSPGIAFGNEVIIGDDAQQSLPTDNEGEVLVRGPNVMREYRKNPEATAASLSTDGWLRTGDLGRMDADGYVFITGRLKELIIKGGENIAPREIDEALYTHPDVIEAAAFARACPRYGQTVEAGVMVRDGAAVSEDDLIALCRKTIGGFKAPDRVHFLPELPKGPSGKIQRIKLSEFCP